MIARRLPFALAAILSAGAVLSGQALTDHAAAVAGAAAGVAGATAIRDPLTRILNAASGETGAAASEKPRPKATKADTRSVAAQAQPSGGAATATPMGSPASGAPARSGWSRPGRSGPILSIAQPSFNRYESSEPSFPVTTAQLRSVASGASSGEVIQSLGIPAARISMEDGGHLVEILEYTANGTRVGSVRCSDGKVESVNAADR